MDTTMRELSNEELVKAVSDAKEEIRKERFKSVTGKVDDMKKIRELKKKIARCHTLVKERELGIRVNKK